MWLRLSATALSVCPMCAGASWHVSMVMSNGHVDSMSSTPFHEVPAAQGLLCKNKSFHQKFAKFLILLLGEVMVVPFCATFCCLLSLMPDTPFCGFPLFAPFEVWHYHWPAPFEVYCSHPPLFISCCRAVAPRSISFACC